MAEVIQFPEKVTTDEYFGGCPTCGKNDGYLNVGRDHWMVCHEHKTRWCVGSNLFSSWWDESEADWQRNEYRMSGYAEVESVNPETIECERCGAEDTPDPFDGAAHSPLCQGESGQFTHLTDDQVRDTLALLDRCGGQVVRKRLPFDPDIDPLPF